MISKVRQITDSERVLWNVIERCVNEGHHVDDIEKNLNRIMSPKSFTVSIIDSNKPFIMSIYPDIDELEQKSIPLINILNTSKNINIFDFVNELNTINHWVIEVDRRLLQSDSPYSASGKEFVAILMHELGHATYTSPLNMVVTYKRRKAMFSMFEKMMLSDSNVVRAIFLPMMVNMMNFRIVTLYRINNTIEELKADMYCSEEYKEYLLAYLDRCILTNSEIVNDVIETPKENENKNEIAVKFTKESLYLMKSRRSVLAAHIESQYKLSPSKYLKEMTNRVSKICLGKDLSKIKRDIVREGYVETKYLREFAEIEKKAIVALESSRVSDRDIFVLQIDADGVKTPEDKVYIIHTVFDYLEMVNRENNKRLKSFRDGKIPLDLLKDPRIDSLNKIKDEVMKKDVNTPQHYGLFIKYPQGYEG